MRPRHYSLFWIGYCAGLLCLSPHFAQRDAPAAELHPAEALDMGDWLRLSEVQRLAIVTEYAPARRLTARYEPTTERRNQDAA